MKVEVLKTWLPNRTRRKKASGIILHSTAGASATSSIAWLFKIGLSYHYIIEDDGTVYKCVPLSKAAFHAGKSMGWDGPNCNEYTIGIAFANKNDGKEPYTPAQVESALRLVKEISSSDPNIKWISTHYLIAPKRKNDPYKFKFFEFSALSGLARWRPSGAQWDL